MAAVFKVPAVFVAIDKMSAPIRRMGRSVKGFTSRLQVAEAKVVRSFRRMTRAVGQFGIALGATALVMVATHALGVMKDFEQANANLSAVLQKSASETKALSDNAKLLGATTAFTATQVVGLQTSYARLGFVEDEILQMTNSTLALAAATNTDLSQAALQVGAALNAFGLEASQAGRVADVFALSTSKSALDMEKLAASMDKVAPIADKFGFGLENSVALLGKLSDAGFDASTAGTATKNILLNMADANGKLAKALGGPVSTMDELVQGLVRLRGTGVDLAGMLELTDKRSVAAFATFLSGAEDVLKLNNALMKAGGTAQTMADTQLDTLQGSLTILKSAYEGFILSLEDGTGPFAKNLRLAVDVAAAMLSMASGMQQTIGPLTERQAQVKKLAENGLQLLNVLKWLAAAYIVIKTVMLAVTAATWLWQTAQLALNLAMSLNPIGLIIIAIIALIALVTSVIVKYKDWGAAITLLMGPLGIIINLVMSFARHWESIKKAFSSGGILAGLKRIGLVLFDAILMPLQQMLELLSNLPGVGDLAASGAAAIEGLRSNLDLVNPEAEQASAK